MNTQEPSASPKDNRRHKRLATLQTAFIQFDDGIVVHAEIRDYCQTGLYVAFQDDSTPDAAIHAVVGSSIKLEFADGDGAGAKTFRIDGHVVHVSSTGAGVYVTAMPEGVLSALRNAGAHLAKSVIAQGGPDLSPQDVQTLKQKCTSLFRRFLDDVTQGFLKLGAEGLRQVALDEQNFIQRARYLHAADELAVSWALIQEDFFRVIRERLQYVESASEVPSVVPAGGDLALIDEDEFEDWLNLSSVINQIEEDVGFPLREFERRYGQLVHMTINGKNNPFGPEAICRSFEDAIRGVDLTNAMRATLYKAFGRAVDRHIPGLYRELNDALPAVQPARPASDQREKTQPESSPAAAVSTAATEASAPENGTTKADLAEIAETLIKLYKQSQSETSPTSANVEYSLDRILASLSQSPRVGSESRRPASADAYPRAKTIPAPAHPDATRPDVLKIVERMQRAYRELPGHAAPEVRQAAGRRGRDRAGLPEASLQELLAAIDNVPMPVKTGQVASVAPPLTEQVETQLAMYAGGGKRLAPAYRQALEATTGLFTTAKSEFLPNSEVESLIKRLERTLLKLALHDDSFPTNPDHPARQLVNLIDQFSVAADDQGRFFDAKLQRFLHLLVDRVCSRAEDEPGIFVTARDSLEKILLPIRKARRTRVARLQEGCEGRDAIRNARARVSEALDQRLAGKEVPDIVLRLLDLGWRQYLTLLGMRSGKYGNEWESGIAVLDRLSARLGPREGNATAEEALALMEEIELKLSTVTVDTNELTLFMRELGGLLNVVASSTVLDIPMVSVPRSKNAVTQTKAGEEQPTPNGPTTALRVGDWWEFSLEGNRVPMQLIWRNQPKTLCAFANRSATHRMELNLTELAKQEKGGLAKPRKNLDLPLLDRSENSLFDETYQHLMHQATHDPITDLLNRKGFMQHLHLHAISTQRDTVHTLCIIEFDQFRTISNACGAETAQKLARDLAGAVSAQIGSQGILATFREDTLALFLHDCSGRDGCHIAEGLLNQLKNHSFQHEQNRYSIGLNIGVAEYAPKSISAAEAIKRADSACITAKSLGRNRMQVYEEAGAELKANEALMELAGRIDDILQGGLYLRSQMVMPISADTTLLPYYEILLGIQSETDLEVGPQNFITSVEHMQRSHEVDMWVLQKVFEWIRSNPSYFESVGGFAINLSGASLGNSDILTFLRNVLPRSGVPTEKIIFEITETAAIESYASAQQFISLIRSYGCKVSIDDFGSGFTSYAHLKNLRVDTLKIDGSYVKDMLQNANDLVMVRSMNDVAHSLGLHTVAEYVETPMILSKLREIGVDYAQGYVIHKPCPIDQILPELRH